MKNIEVDQAECQKIQQQIDEQKAKLEQIRKESEQLATKYEAEIDQIQSEWDEAAKDVPAEFLEVFKRVADTYDGEAVTVIEQQGGPNGTYTCGGCFMGVTMESVNMLMTRDEVIRCPNCTRILVLEAAKE
ncbi:MAG: C4-type zinc ribbon domain-containing protein [Sedimentisphaerales bacterium]